MFKWLLKYFAIVFILIGTLVFAVPFVVPLDDYQPILEAQLSQSIGRKVMIGELSPQVMPQPALSATNVSILGSTVHPGELFVEQMHATLDPLELLNGRVVIRSIHLNGVGSNLAFIRSLINHKPNETQSSSQPSPLAVQSISGSNVTLRADDETRLGPYRFNLFLNDELKLKEIYLSRMDGTLRATIKPDQNNSYTLQASGNHWQLPVSPAFKFDTLNVQAVLHKDKAELTNIEMKGYNGLITSNGTLSWRNGWQYDGQLKSTNIEMTPILKHFDINSYHGRFNSDLNIKLMGNTLGELFTNPEAKGKYHIASGMIIKEDSSKPALTFDQFSGDGHLTTGSLKSDNTILKTAGGTIQGITHFFWQKNWSIKGWVVASEIDAETFLSGFIDEKVTSGTFYANAEFALTANDNEKLLTRPYLSGEFRMANGKIFKADLEKASTTLSKEGSHGGETVFQHLSGHARFENNHIKLSDVEIISDSMSANGDIRINPQDELEGEITVALRKTASLISAPLKVSGTVSDPSLRLTNDAIIGGVIGTSVLGPGIGTAVGMKVGGLIKKIGSIIGSGKKDDVAVLPAVQ